MIRGRKSICAWTVVACIAASCGPNDNNTNVIIDPTNNDTSNTTNNKTNQDTNNDTTNNDNNTIPTNNSEEGCEELEIETFEDTSVDIEREFNESGQVDLLTCREEVGEIAVDGSYVIRLQYSQPATVDINVNAIPTDEGIPPRPGLELRRAACADGETVLCDTESSYQDVTLEANVPYFLFVNGLLSSGGFTLHVDGNIAECTPGEMTCSDGDLSVCNEDGSRLFETTCPGDCAGDQCVGDQCTTPVTVAPEVNGDPVTIEGNRGAFTGTWDTMEGAGCQYDDTGPVPTPGPEFFVVVEGVQSGQTVVLDAEQSFDNYIFFVIEDCDATTCIDGFFFDENSRNRASYTASADGDVLFAVEAAGPPDPSDFIIEASIRE